MGRAELGEDQTSLRLFSIAQSHLLSGQSIKETRVLRARCGAAPGCTDQSLDLRLSSGGKMFRANDETSNASGAGPCKRELETGPDRELKTRRGSGKTILTCLSEDVEEGDGVAVAQKTVSPSQVLVGTTQDATTEVSLSIPKPPGTLCRPGRGGYNLFQTLGWDRVKYERIYVSLIICS